MIKRHNLKTEIALIDLVIGRLRIPGYPVERCIQRLGLVSSNRRDDLRPELEMIDLVIGRLKKPSYSIEASIERLMTVSESMGGYEESYDTLRDKAGVFPHEKA